MREFADLYGALPERRETGERFSPKGLALRWQRLLRRIRTRRALQNLDARLLADVGLIAEQARAEASRSLWQLLREA